MTKKKRIKTWILIIITCVICFPSWSFAANGDGDALSFSLNYIVSVLGRIWVFFANLAGTFLTNKWIYGEILWWDSLLWKYWNIMKNIANFWLWFYFIYVLFKWLVGQKGSSIIQNFKKIIVRLLVAWIWIQASWFFVATVIDISSITLAAAGAFPSQVISSSSSTAWSIRQSLSEYISQNQIVDKSKKITLFPDKNSGEPLLKTETLEVTSNENYDGLVDSFMPNSDNISWPLYFIWFSILKTNVITSINTSDDQWIKATLFNTIMQWWTTIIFSIEMAILCILAIMRILYLRMFIILSPLAILIRCIDKSWEKIWNDNKSFLSKFAKHINFKTFFINVFKPTIIVLWFGIALLFVSLMNKVVLDYNDTPLDIGWVTISRSNPKINPNENAWDNKYTSNIDSKLVSFTLRSAWKDLLDLLLSIITVIIVYFIIKVAISLWDWEDFISKNITNVQKEVWNLMGNIPVIPVAWYDEQGKPTTHYINANQTFGIWGKSSIIEEKIRRQSWKEREKISKENEIINSRFGNKIEYLSSSEKTTVSNALTMWKNSLDQLNNVKSEIAKLAKEEWRWLTLNAQTDNGRWRNQFEDWLSKANKNITWTNNNKNWQDMIKTWQDKKKESKNYTLEQLFSNQYYRDAYANFFGLSNINSWTDLENADISKK